MEVNLLDNYPKSQRPIKDRGLKVKEEHREIARQFGKEYFDEDRLTGYGGYEYDARFWTKTVKRFAEYYSLSNESSILDVGCAKGFMLYDFKLVFPNSQLTGLDISPYAIEHAKPEMRDHLLIGNAVKLPFEKDSFDLVISINTIHNLELEECKEALRQIEVVSSKNSFITVDAWRNEDERDALMDWNLTAKTFMHVDDWKQLFSVGYIGDYFWFIAETI